MNSGDDIIDIIRHVRHARRPIFIGMLVGLSIAIILSLSIKPQYEARMIIAPAAPITDEPFRYNKELGYSEIYQSTAQNSVPNNFLQFEQIFREASTASILIKYDGVLKQVNNDFAFKIHFSNSISTNYDLSMYLNRKIRIYPIGSTSSRVVTFRHPDPVFAEKLLKHIYTITDGIIRQQNKEKAQERVAFLQEEMKSSYHPDHRKALTDLLVAEERTKMLTSLDQAYAAEMIEPPSVSTKPVWPKKKVIFPVMILLGGFIGFFVSFYTKRK